MKLSKRMVVAVPVVMAAVLAVAMPALGQVQVNNNGTARDANTRVGSGGLNDRPRNLQLYSADDVAYGRVTGGRGFRGNLTGDPTQAFGGRGGLPSDQILRRGNPSVTPAAPTLPAGTYAVPFYSGSSPTANTPSNFVLNSYTGQYVYQPGLRYGAEDIQFGVPPGTPVIRPGAGGESQLVLPATVWDSTGRSATGVMTASPLLGVRPLSGLTDEDQYLFNRSMDWRTPGEPPLDPTVMRELRQELRRTMLTPAQIKGQVQIAAEQGAALQQAQTPESAQAAMLQGNRVDARLGQNAQVQPAPTNAQLGGVPPIARPDPAERNPLLLELRRMETERLEARERAARQGTAAPRTGVPGVGVVPSREGEAPASRPAGSGETGAVAVPKGEVTETVRAARSVPVDSLSARQGNAGIKALTKSAEDLMAKGRFASAVDRYEAVRRFAPDDATVIVARMHAELGGGFFARAETSLRQAVALDAAVLNARYDLSTTIGAERLKKLVEDLKKLAVDNKDDSMPVLLLGYIAYNSGDVERTSSLLVEAGNRAPKDTLPGALKSRWLVEESKP